MRYGIYWVLAAFAWVAQPLCAEPIRQDISALSGPEITTLQRRLADAGCYKGAFDGRPSEETKAAVAACPDQRPRLIIETGMHVAQIQNMAVDKACKLMATVSTDKTLRLWSLPDGAAQKVIRLPQGEGSLGKLYAVAVSPDRRFVVAGGWDARNEVIKGHGVYVFDTSSGNLLARLGAYDDVIDNMAFSPDGHWLVVNVADRGVVMLDTSGADPSAWSEVSRDMTYKGDSYGSAFGSDGRLATTSYDGKIRLYAPGPSFRKLTEAVMKDAPQPVSVSFDPGVTRIAVGYTSSTPVTLLDANDLHRIGGVDTTGIDNNDIGQVMWSADGQRLLAAGGYLKDGQTLLMVYDRNGRKVGTPRSIGRGSVLSLQACGNAFAYATAGPSFGLIDAGMTVKRLRLAVTANMINKLDDKFTVSADGRSVRFGLERSGGTPVLFDLARASLDDAPVDDPALARPNLKGITILDWQDSVTPKLGKKRLDINSGETSRSLVIRRDAKGFVVGGSWSIDGFDAKGKQLWRRQTIGDTWGVNLAANDNLVLAAGSDGTVRWYRWSDGQELLAMFVNAETRAWVAWTPGGYYSASPGGEDMIGWLVNRGYGQLADFFPADRFRNQFARPDIVDRILTTRDEAEAVRQANAARPVKVEAMPLLDNLPPVISILAPQDGALLDGTQMTLSYIVRSPSGLPVEAVEVRLDGRPLAVGRDPGNAAFDGVRQCLDQTNGAGKVEGALQGCRGTVTVQIPAGATEIGLAARAGTRFGEAAMLRIGRKAAPAAPAANDNFLKPKLYALIVGVSDYVNPDYRLGLAAKDANDFRAVLDNQKGGLYGEVTVKVLTDRQATGVAIKEGLDWLGRQVTTRDVAMVYFAGHGEIDARSGRFYLLPADADRSRLFSTALSREDFNLALELVPGKAIVFLDACHSAAIGSGTQARGLGATNINDVVKGMANADNGVVLFTASTGRQVSQENLEWGNGAFTKALVEGLGRQGVRAKANMLDNGAITLSELETFVSERVKQLTNGAQSPVLINSKGVPNYPIALVR